MRTAPHLPLPGPSEGSGRPKAAELPLSTTTRYWRPGNSEPFLGLVERLTGKPLTGDPWVAVLRQDVEALLREEKAAYEAAEKAESAAAPEINLDMRIKIVDGDAVIADTAEEGGFLATCSKFERYVRQRFFP